MKGIILFKSKYGSTRKYAEWLSEATGFKAVETDKADLKEVDGCDTVIIGGGLYASGMNGLSFLKKNIGMLKGKKVIAFCCGASPYEETYFKSVRDYNMKDAIADIPLFYCRGGCDLKNMSFKDRTLCKMLIKSLAKKDPKDMAVWEKALVDAGESAYDCTDREYLKPVLEAIGI
ncbi:flavodoxin domain-containing protein [Butyrivibrio sp. AE2032]|uniref:flavodoxin domain-containing protein n=1 Tax=Butyrivibrio sp. AE2032 TaxID=1458463 RepID=UPI000558D357|nr:flavodoxin domain-containing protein [Butyrivibrio sp. AE2032]